MCRSKLLPAHALDPSDPALFIDDLVESGLRGSRSGIAAWRAPSDAVEAVASGGGRGRVQRAGACCTTTCGFATSGWATTELRTQPIPSHHRDFREVPAGDGACEARAGGGRRHEDPGEHVAVQSDEPRADGRVSPRASMTARSCSTNRSPPPGSPRQNGSTAGGMARTTLPTRSRCLRSRAMRRPAPSRESPRSCAPSRTCERVRA